MDFLPSESGPIFKCIVNGSSSVTPKLKRIQEEKKVFEVFGIGD